MKEANKMAIPPHVAIYVRVSTKEQAEEGLSMEAQPALCINKLEELFGAGMFTYEIFKDAGISGGKGPKPWATEILPRERKGLWDMIQRIRQDEFTHVIAFRSDRIYRDHLGFLGFYSDLLKPRGVKLLFVAEEFDESLTGQLTAGMLAGVAEWQRKQIGENIMRTLTHRRASGYYLGYPPFGWRIEQPHEHEGRRPNIVPDDLNIQTVKRIREMFLDGHGFSTIAKTLNSQLIKHQKGVGKWSHGTVGNILKCPIHAGLLATGKEGTLIKGIHFDHRIYEPEDFEEIQAKIARNRRRLKGVASSQPFRMFRGLAYCGLCGAPLNSQFNQPTPTYMCFGDRATDDGSHVFINAKRLESAILDVIVGVASSQEIQGEAHCQIEQLVLAQDESLRNEAGRLRKSLEELDRQSQNLTSALKDGAIPHDVARTEFKKIESEKLSLREKAIQVDAELSSSSTRTELAFRAKEALKDIPLLWESMSDTEKREALHTVIERIDVYVGDTRKHLKVKLAMSEEPIEIEVLTGASRYRSRRLDGPASLTLRELAALYHCLNGADYNKVAEYFGTSRTNAHNILTRATRKVGAKNHLAAAKKMEKTLRQFSRQLPLYGVARPVHKAKALRVCEYQILQFVAKGHEMTEIAGITAINVERVIELHVSALKKTSSSDASAALDFLQSHSEVLPFSVQNREKAI